MSRIMTVVGGVRITTRCMATAAHASVTSASMAGVTAAVPTVAAAPVATVLGVRHAGRIEKREEDEYRNGMRTAHEPPTFWECYVPRATSYCNSRSSRNVSRHHRLFGAIGPP